MWEETNLLSIITQYYTTRKNDEDGHLSRNINETANIKNKMLFFLDTIILAQIGYYESCQQRMEMTLKNAIWPWKMRQQRFAFVIFEVQFWKAGNE